MFKRVLCWLLLPLCAMGVLAGCGKNKTTEKLQQLYAGISEEFSKNGHYFQLDGTDKKPTCKIAISYEGEMAHLDNTEYVKGFASDEQEYEVTDIFKNGGESLYSRYYALLNIQQPILLRLSEYYDTWQERFYDGMELVQVEKGDINRLYSLLERLKEDMRTFESARLSVQSDVDVLTFTGALRSTLTNYSYEFNRLIESYADFINEFQNVQVKYLFDNNAIPEKNNETILNRLMDEFYVNMSQAIYYKLLKAFDRTSECDLQALLGVIAGEGYNTYLQIVNRCGTTFNFDKFNSHVSDESKIEDFMFARNSFVQKFEIYKQVYEKVDYYSYNEACFNGADALKAYLETLDSVERADIKLIQSFEDTVVEEYITTFSALAKLG